MFAVVKEKMSKIPDLLKYASTFVFYRWVFLLLVIPTLYYTINKNISSNHTWFILTFMVACFYNYIVSVAINRNYRNKKKYNIPAEFDLVFLSLFCLMTNYYESDLYYFILILIIFTSVINYNKTKYYFLKLGIMSLVLFLIVSFTGQLINPTVSIPQFISLVFIRIVGLITSVAIGIIIKNELLKYYELHRREFELARTDKLTGLANRHYLEQKVREEVEYVKKTRNPINIMIFDLDNFKKFNDTFGHLYGDRLLEHFSSIILQNIRKTDTAVRYGGEEFLIIIKDLDINLAKSIGERIRKQLENQMIYIQETNSNVKVTASCGISQYTYDTGSIDITISQADKALYYAKATGKNKIVLYEEIFESNIQKFINRQEVNIK